MSAPLWQFFAGSEIDDSELPLKEHRREKSPEEAEAFHFWQSIVDFFVGTEVEAEAAPKASHAKSAASPAKGAASPAKQASSETLAPARDSKRGRDDEPAPSRTPSKLAAALSASSADKLAKDASITAKELEGFIAENGGQVPPKAKKADLVKLAQKLNSETAAPSTPAKTASAVSEAASPKEDDEAPSTRWTITRLKSYADAKGIKYANDALKSDIFDLVVQAASPKRAASSQSLSRAASKSKK